MYPTLVPSTYLESHLWFIELLAWWQGRVNATDLSRHFAISRTQANKYMQRYRALFPDNLDYCKTIKGFVPQPNFSLRCISGDASEYLDWLDKQGSTVCNSSAHSSHQFDHQPITHTSLTLPKRQVSPVIMRALVSAIRTRQRLEIGYVSLSTPDDQGRVIQPHTFVKTGLRWHLRAYCEKSSVFKDFVLSRFRGEPELSGPARHDPAEDLGWNTQITLTLQPDPRLSAAQRQIIEHDYQMQNGELKLPVRAALAQYLLQELQVSTKFLAGSGEAQQLVLVNRDEVKPWLFDS
ncbi:WYL domain-containing protein [Bowmanella sp. Y26]|uniref:WYL domain-containing protein n=1 Tax=Bowmanella yangjiangensis TaxID=2811230 RepID=UPI001BDBF463|nr:WYL domain-containing protein [Bowmanella yangjiangensis]MBT1062639.1 WYL domain-containing protein [Bowmanella yangjiangensis]